MSDKAKELCAVCGITKLDHFFWSDGVLRNAQGHDFEPSGWYEGPPTEPGLYCYVDPDEGYTEVCRLDASDFENITKSWIKTIPRHCPVTKAPPPIPEQPQDSAEEKPSSLTDEERQSMGPFAAAYKWQKLAKRQEAKISELEATVQARNAERIRLDETIRMYMKLEGEQTEKISELEETIADQSKEISDLRATLLAVGNQRDGYKAQVDFLSSSCAKNAQEVISDKNATITDLKVEVGDREEKIRTRDKMIRELQAKLDKPFTVSGYRGNEGPVSGQPVVWPEPDQGITDYERHKGLAEFAFRVIKYKADKIPTAEEIVENFFIKYGELFTDENKD